SHPPSLPPLSFPPRRSSALSCGAAPAFGTCRGPLRAGALGSRGLLAVGPIGLEGDRDRLPRLERRDQATGGLGDLLAGLEPWQRWEEHTSELQSRFDLVCRL